ncbi:MAG TPA: FixH family protein [Chryseolinea sp.]|nr:FixH family protein [Chryseolinea sp.]
MNFGKWIVVSFILFTVFIGTLVTVCMRQDIDLVSKDYYKEELAYQDQIERLNNTEILSTKPTVQLMENNILQIKLNQSDEIKNGELILFCPSNSKMDRKFKLSALPGESDLIELKGLDKGMYKAKLLWTMDDKEFYVEEVINI